MTSRKGGLELRVLGVMTGTSCDGLDATCLGINPDGWTLRWSKSLPYPSELKKRVLEAQKPGFQSDVLHWQELHRDLGRWYAKSLVSVIAKHKAYPPDLIANHGQTVAHFPAKGITLQLGDASWIASQTGLTVVSRFREGDIAAGGQGAPLVPLFHQMLAGSLGETGKGVAIHNIGGISNLTYMGPKDRIIAFDTGPGNIWIDAATQKVTQGKKKFDDGGDLALQGRADFNVVEKIMTLPFFKKAPPKSTGRDEFPFQILSSMCHSTGPALVSTATALTIESIAVSYERWIIRKGLPLESIYVCGGGAKNTALLEGLRARLDPVAVYDLAEMGIDPQFVESQAFALFGFISLLGKPLGGPWTGAKGFGPPGQIIPGANWKTVLSKLRPFL
jgi:anhydro-N-acetylmuramic acid kinase